MLRQLGHTAVVLPDYTSQRCDLLVTLHAVKTAAAVRRFRERNPGRPVVVAVTGTDVFADPPTVAVAHATLRAADRVLCLQAHTPTVLPAELVPRCRVIFQSADPVPNPMPPRTDVFEVCVLGHLRPVKGPFLAAEAARRLPADSRIRIVHIGGALSPDMADRARAEEAENPRYRWLGELPRPRAMRRLAGCRLLAMTSRSEGGPSAASEALANRVPVVSTRTSGVVGLLGDDYPGLVDVNDAGGLSALFRRCETEPAFLRELGRWCGRKRPLVAPAREAAAWGRLLGELGRSAGRGPS